MRALAILALLASAPTVARADLLEDEDTGPKGQVSLNLQFGSGYRAIFPTDNEFCGTFDDAGAPASNCVGRSPAQLGIQLGYAFTDSVAVYAELGVGLEKDFGTLTARDDGPRPLFFAPGIRGFVTDVGPLQMFSGLQFVIDFTDFGQAPGNDYAVRNINGLQFDVHRTFGINLYFGESVGFRRWLSFNLEAGIGLQARFP